jgi:mono/diheme cytochrome c family protein
MPPARTRRSAGRAAALLPAVLLACGSDAGPPPPAALPPDSVAPRVPADAGALPLDGLAIHRAACAECHAIDGDPIYAPTLREIARRYRQRLRPDEAEERIIEYIRAPAFERTLLEKAQLDEWGVMPPVELPDAHARAVARWLLDLEPDVAPRGIGARGTDGTGPGRSGPGARLPRAYGPAGGPTGAR